VVQATNALGAPLTDGVSVKLFTVLFEVIP
jgi:hypothetical protein